MHLTINLCFTLVILKLATCATEHPWREQNIDNGLPLSKVVQYLVETSLLDKSRRSINAASLAKARQYYNSLKKHAGRSGGGEKHALRMSHDPRVMKKDEHAALVEKELKIALAHKKSALYDRPYVEKQGKNDYLVMRPEVLDPFVTVIPNHIYYSIEKKCVNWLDDCSLNGIRQRLLRGVSSP